MPATQIPDMLRETMSDFGMSAVDHWWADLEEAARADVIELWRATSFSQPCVARVAAHFVDDKHRNDDSELWHNDFYEYLVNHEIYLLDPHPPHICTQHQMARAAVASGFIPSSFTCPLSHQDCPMRQLLRLSPCKSVILRISFVSTFAERGNVERGAPHEPLSRL